MVNDVNKKIIYLPRKVVFFFCLFVCVCVWSTTARFLVQKCAPLGRVRNFRSSGGIPVVYLTLTRTQKKKKTSSSPLH